MIQRMLLMLCLVPALAGCAAISVTPLGPNGKALADQDPGIRYYMPAPYLLVARLPSPPKSDGAAASSDPAELDASGKPVKAKPTTTSTSDSSPGAPSDTSFLATNSQYTIKLVYLPDLSKPMAMKATAGIGSVALKPTLQDGWMLTSLDSSADGKVAETLTALASAFAGGGKASSSGGGGKPASDTAGSEKGIDSQAGDVLVPGLYRFEYDSGGYLKRLCAVTLFDARGLPRRPDSGVECNGPR